jgi:hypothetical protein
MATASVAIVTVACARDAVPRRPDTLPERLSDSAFWALTTHLSEPSGFFHSENFVSNELTYQYVIPALATPARMHGVYLGVGPEQNFAYIAALAPKIAFILDIRRQNLIEQLFYKTCFELSSDRPEFVSRLFSRPRPIGIDSTATPSTLFAAYEAARPDTALFRANLRAVIQRLTVTHRWPLDTADLAMLQHVAETFFAAGPAITYDSPGAPSPTVGGRFIGRFGPRGMPSYTEVMVARDSAGVSRGYLSDEAHFRAVQSLEVRNMVVPVVGDFGGPKALRAIGGYLRDHDATLSAVYVSNVEQYLFQSDAWRRYYENLGTVPLSPASTFIRSIRPPAGDQRVRSVRLVSTLSPVEKFLAEYKAGKIRWYTDVAKVTW